MKLEQQVVSLDIAKRLKELGVDQGRAKTYFHNALFWWSRIEGEAVPKLVYGPHVLKRLRGADCREKYAAFTVAELGEMLPLLGKDLYTFRASMTGRWNVQYEKLGVIMEADTEADARGKMLIYLLENKLVNG